MGKEPEEPCDWDMPAWVTEKWLDRTTPYTEEELDLLVESTLEGIRDTASWQNLVDRVGQEEARRILRSRLIMQDENARRLPRH
jgi:hypothetical protein